ncbi:MAG: response regulator [Magnetococcales bacterium]|nr:response regulator [Magnetococcales bacterium]
MNVLLSSRRNRLLLSLFLLLFSFSLMATWLVISKQREMLLDDHHQHYSAELTLMSAFLRESLNSGNQQAIDIYLENVLRKHPNMIALKAVKKKGVELFNFSGPKPTGQYQTITGRVKLPDDDYLDLTLEVNLSEVEKNIASLHQWLATLFTLFFTFLGVALWFVIKKIALDPLDLEQERQKAQLLENTNQELRGEIGERNRVEMELRKNEQRFRALFDAMTSGVAIYEAYNDGEDFIFKDFNKASEKINAISKEKVLGRRVTEVFPGIRDFGLFEVFQQVHRTGKPAHHPITFYLDDRTQGWLENYIYQLDSGELVAIYDDLTDKKQAENAMRQYANMVSASEDHMSFLDRNYIYRAVNNAYLINCAKKEEEILGYSVSDLLGEAVFQSIKENLDRCLAGESINYRATFQFPSTGQRYMDVSYFPQYDAQGEVEGIVVAARDITERNQLKMALVESEQRLSLIAENIDAVLWMVSPDADSMLYVSPAYETIWGHSCQQLYDDPHLWKKSIHIDDKQRIAIAFQEMKKSGKLDEVYRINRTDGAIRWIHHSAFPISDLQGNTERIAGVAVDITQQKQGEILLHAARDQAEAANRAKSDFLANMSHEIRTPMNTITGMGYLALQTNLTKQQQGYINKITTAANSLLRIIDDILDFSKIDAGKLTLESIPFTLEEVFGQLMDATLLQAEKKGVEVLFSSHPDLPQQLVGDPGRLGQVLTNLCSNAVKFTEKGEIVISTEPVEMRDDQITLRFEVRDSGIGMTADQLDRLFDPFHQADSSTTRKYGGTGLGLSICQNLVKMMGGNIYAKSILGKGTQLIFTARFQYKKGLVATPDEIPESIRNMRILVVDDNSASQEVLQTILSSLSFNNSIVDSGKKAITELKRAVSEGEQPYDLILMDWVMPDLDGLETAALIHQDADFPTPPTVIMVSSFDQDKIIGQGKQELFAGFIHKPVNASTLFDTLIRIMGQADKPSESPHAIPPHEPKPYHTLQSSRVLVVDDLEDNRTIVQEILERRGIQVTLANNGQEAVQRITQATSPFHAVLMDIQMPVMDGFQATQEIRSRPETHSLPIIAMTASAMVQDVEKCLAAGMNSHIAKPFDVKELFATLARWIEPKQAQSTPPATTNPDGEAGLPDHLPGIHIDKALRIMDDDKALLARMVSRFPLNNSQAIPDIRLALEQGDVDTAQRVAHSLKGVAGNIAAVELSTTAAEMEQAFLKGDIQTGKALLPTLEVAMDDILQSVQILQDQQHTPTATQKQAASTRPTGKVLETLITQMVELENRLKKRDMMAASLWEEILKVLAKLSELEEQTTALGNCIENLDYPKALTMIQDLIPIVSALEEKQ